MKIVFMGTPDFAVPTLERLCDSPHEVVCVVTQPDQPSGRGHHVHPSPVKQAALRRGLPVLQPEKLRGTDFHKTLAAYSPDLIVVAAYGKILPPEILQAPRLGCLNVHASLLPKYRGAAPVARAIINGERETGVTIMHMDEGLDTGGIVAQRSVEILDDDDGISLSNILSAMGADLLIEALQQVEEAQKIVSTPQDHSQATYAPMLKKSDGDLDWSSTSEQIICHMHGLNPWPGCHSALGEKTFRLIDADRLVEAETASFSDGEYEPGEVACYWPGRGPVVRTGDGYIVLTRAQPAGRKVLTGTDLLNGGYVRVGMRFERIGDKKSIESQLPDAALGEPPSQ
ncbi:methionyl-tRNA formyltransferase [Candidatus Sumerlaeota bacterium]|nr:methionyl-tRNA formyltransferase [Candidatus Sumerlaeota bacterium]